MESDTFYIGLTLLALTLSLMLLSIYILLTKTYRIEKIPEQPTESDITLSELNYIKAQLKYYREEKQVCEEKMRSYTITLEGYNTLRKYWEGISTMIDELEEILA